MRTENIYHIKVSFISFALRSVWAFYFIILPGPSLFAQCPVNIDFESGTFAGWTCMTGSVRDTNGLNIMDLQIQPGPVPGQHTMLSNFPGDGLDEYGGFPKNCPNGSGHSIKLGNDQAGGYAEGIFYQFTVPANSNKFTLTYNYAVVFEDPGHASEEQPRLEIEIRNLTDDEVLECFSFAFVADNSLPGFQISPLRPNHTPILYKDWTTNTVYLNGYQGKNIGLYMRTADCTYAIHFGYAYLDVSSKCDNSYAGETFCAGDTMVEVNAPNGYQQYTWFDDTFSQVLGNTQLLHLEPVPPAGTNVHVELVPYPGYGCRDTLEVNLQDTLHALANAGPDQSSCNFNPVQLGVLPINGIRYDWSPATGLSNAAVSNPIALPSQDTRYILSIQGFGGGCQSQDTVNVFVRNIDNRLTLTGDSLYCVGTGPPPKLSVQPVHAVQWFRDGFLIPGANGLEYEIGASGNYSALLFSDICSDPVATRLISFVIDTPKQGISYPVLDIAYNFPMQLQARDFGGAVRWNPSNYLDNPNSYTPVFRSDNGEQYTISIINSVGCITVDTQVIKTHKEIAIYVPTAFVPGGTGPNSTLRPLLLGFRQLNYFRVFDRWGKFLYQTKADFPGWDGKINNQPLETQTVVWMLEAVDIDGKTHTRRGTSLLLH